MLWLFKNRPLSDYEWMCQLDETKGIILEKASAVGIVDGLKQFQKYV